MPNQRSTYKNVPTKPTRVLVVDPHREVRLALRTWCQAQAGLLVMGLAASRRQACKLLALLQTDLVILDARIDQNCPDKAGLLEIIQQQYPSLPVVIFTLEFDFQAVTGNLTRAACAYISKQEGDHELRRGIRQVLAGKTYLSPQARRAIALTGTAATKLDRR